MVPAKKSPSKTKRMCDARLDSSEAIVVGNVARRPRGERWRWPQRKWREINVAMRE